MLEAGLGVGTLFLPDNGDRRAVETAETSLKGFIIGEFAVAGKRREFGEKPVDIFKAMRTVRMAGDLRLLPGRQLAVDILQRIGRAFLEAANLVAHLDAALFLREFFQLKNLAFEVGDGFFKIEIVIHRT